MSVTRSPLATMTADAFLAWSEGQGGSSRHELFDGHVVKMSAERAIHTRTKFAVTRCLERAIAERHPPCEALVDGMAVRVDDETVFEPDALVRCGQALPDDALVITDPVIVVEVASPSTQRVDALLKLTRYFRNPAIIHCLIVMPDQRSVCHHRRDANGRIETGHPLDGTAGAESAGTELRNRLSFP